MTPNFKVQAAPLGARLQRRVRRLFDYEMVDHDMKEDQRLGADVWSAFDPQHFAAIANGRY